MPDLAEQLRGYIDGVADPIELTDVRARPTVEPAPPQNDGRHRGRWLAVAAIAVIAVAFGSWWLLSGDGDGDDVETVDDAVVLTRGWVHVGDPFGGGTLIDVASNGEELMAVVERSRECAADSCEVGPIEAWRSGDGVAWSPAGQVLGRTVVPDDTDWASRVFVSGVAWDGRAWLALGSAADRPTYWPIDGTDPAGGSESFNERVGMLRSLSLVGGEPWFGGSMLVENPGMFGGGLDPSMWVGVGPVRRDIPLVVPERQCADGEDWIAAVARGGPGYVAVNAGCSPGLWMSTDGQDWAFQDLAYGDVGGGRRIRGGVWDAVSWGDDVLVVGDIAGSPGGWRIDGEGEAHEIGPFPSDVVDPDEYSSSATAYGVASGQHGLVAVGWSQMTGTEAIWVSEDGVHWTRADLPGAADFAPLMQVVPLGDGFVAGTRRSGTADLFVWTP